ncbi:GNAT family N-acetyltransferase [Zafaria sp. Z1313]|uniref:GNAT family N-acetyltransferase n=1 Tax=unclassified Zafaria TaxID=2828765 RepID=UPI002E7A23D2|nr:GNAT family N-acetyltransferase [Zafaria sp. J156]MEE1621483.1 GNAT family N-acetyltransferase [Zafaria sp. J156]
MALEWSTITEQDTAEWARLTNELAVADQTEEFYEPEDLAEELEEPGVDPARDTWAVREDGRLVAFGQVRISDALRDGFAKAHLGGGVHPEHRRRGIGRALMERLEDRARELGGERHAGHPLLLDVWAGRPESGAARMASVRGYEPARYFQDMKVELGGWEVPAGAAPCPGVVFDPAHAEGIRRAHNEAFADHWGSSARSPEKWAAQLKARSFRPAYSRTVLSDDPGLDPEEAVDAYVLSGQWVPKELYVSLVGTRRRARGRGHAAALLTDVVRQAKEDGYASVELGVDSDSPTGAVGLYERVGFRRVRTNVVYSRRA